MTGMRSLSHPLQRPIRLAVLISGGGTTLTNLVQKIHSRDLHAEIPLVIASRPDCGGIQRALDAGLHCHVIDRKKAGSIDDFSDRIFEQCRSFEIDLVVCGGFLSLCRIPADFLGRVINIHPSLIPAFCGRGFYGHHVHEAVLERGAKVSGCTVHFVDNEYDHGPIILQNVVEVRDDDDAQTLANRVFAQECEALPEAIRLISEARLEIRGSRVHRVI